MEVHRVIIPSNRALPEGLDASVWQGVVERAAAAWSYPQLVCSSLTLHVLPAKPLRSARQDGNSVIVFRSERWCHNERCDHRGVFPTAAAAMTTTHPPGSRGLEVL